MRCSYLYRGLRFIGKSRFVIAEGQLYRLHFNLEGSFYIAFRYVDIFVNISRGLMFRFRGIFASAPQGALSSNQNYSLPCKARPFLFLVLCGQARVRSGTDAAILNGRSGTEKLSENRS